MSHSQIELKNLGNIVASYKKKNFDEIISEYEKHLKIIPELGFFYKLPLGGNAIIDMHTFGFQMSFSF